MSQTPTHNDARDICTALLYPSPFNALSRNKRIRTSIPFRLDRLPWSQFHLLVVIGLGITWILDGLEVTIVGSLGHALQSSRSGIIFSSK
jgi:hypothetical protein